MTDKPTPIRNMKLMYSLDKILSDKKVKLNSPITFFGSSSVSIYHAYGLARKNGYSSKLDLKDLSNYMMKNPDILSENENLTRVSKDLDLIVSDEEDFKTLTEVFGEQVNSVYLNDTLVHEMTVLIDDVPVELFYNFKINEEKFDLGKVGNISLDSINPNEIYINKLNMKKKYESEFNFKGIEKSEHDLKMLNEAIPYLY